VLALDWNPFWGSGFGVEDLGFRIQGLGFRAWVSRFEVLGFGFKV
jgi:hypothetical protein